MNARDVLDVLDTLGAAGVEVWLDGGWGVDALIGRQTRDHEDVDVVIALDQADAARDALAAREYAVTLDDRPTRLVLEAAGHRSIDVHTVRFDAEGGGVQILPDGSAFRYPPEGFAGIGVVGGQTVRCLTPQVQDLCHRGYDPDGKDYHDMRLLREHFGLTTPWPPVGDPDSTTSHDGFSGHN